MYSFYKIFYSIRFFRVLGNPILVKSKVAWGASWRVCSSTPAPVQNGPQCSVSLQTKVSYTQCFACLAYLSPRHMIVNTKRRVIVNTIFTEYTCLESTKECEHGSNIDKEAVPIAIKPRLGCIVKSMGSRVN